MVEAQARTELLTGIPPELVAPAQDAFLLDVDGTILDIASTPDAVKVPESLRQNLARLQQLTRGAAALVSGRTIANLDELFAPLQFVAIGCHGAEWRTDPAGAVEMRASRLTPEMRQVLLAAITGLEPVRVEDKTYTIAFHYRQSPQIGPELERRLAQALEPLAADFRLLRGKCVIEVKSRFYDKGESVRALLLRAPFAGRRPVFLGDDTTDADALLAVRALGGLGISVGRSMPEAELMLPTPGAARRWLARVAGEKPPDLLR